MEEIVSLPPMEFFNDDYQMVLDFIESLGNPKYKIAGDIYLSGNRDIITLGNLVEVGEYLNISSTKITSLADNLTVGGSMNISNTYITSLPDNLTVQTNLILTNTYIASLPDNLTVGKDLFLYNTPLSKKYSEEDIRKMIENKGGFVKGDIYI